MNTERDEALALVAQVGVSEAARRLGKPKGTIGRWVHEAKEAKRNETVAPAKQAAPAEVVALPPPARPAPAPSEVLAWMRQTGSGPKAGGKHFRIPTDDVREMVAAERAAVLARAKDLARPRDDTETDPTLEGRTKIERLDLAIDKILTLIANDPQGRGTLDLTRTLGMLLDKRAALASLEAAAAAPDLEAAPAPDPSTPEGRAALLADLLKMPPDLLDEAREMQRAE